LHLQVSRHRPFQHHADGGGVLLHPLSRLTWEASPARAGRGGGGPLQWGLSLSGRAESALRCDLDVTMCSHIAAPSTFISDPTVGRRVPRPLALTDGGSAQPCQGLAVRGRSSERKACNAQVGAGSVFLADVT